MPKSKTNVKVLANIRGHKKEYHFTNKAKLESELKRIKRAHQTYIKVELDKQGMKPYFGKAIEKGQTGQRHMLEHYNSVTDFVPNAELHIEFIDLNQ